MKVDVMFFSRAGRLLHYGIALVERKAEGEDIMVLRVEHERLGCHRIEFVRLRAGFGFWIPLSDSIAMGEPNSELGQSDIVITVKERI